jgi:hypothetical protein
VTTVLGVRRRHDVVPSVLQMSTVPATVVESLAGDIAEIER